MADNTISSRIDELLSRDITNLSPEEIVNIVTGGEQLPEYVDLQSEEGFNKELEKTEKAVQDIVKSLEPQKLPIPIEAIENLACNLEGDELYTEVLLESIKVKDPNLYEEIKKSPEFIDSQKIESKDLGISSNIKSLNSKSNKPSSGVVRFMENKNPDLLRDVNESLFDNLDPLLFGKPSNSGSKKRRSLKILGFSVPLEFIMAKGKILHVKILGPDLTIDQAKERIKKSTAAQKKNTNPCDSMEKTDTDGNPLGPNDQKIVGGVGPVEGGEDTGDYGKLEDSGLGTDTNLFQGDDPLINPDCDPVVPEDPITGDPIATVENFNAISNDFCDPPEADFTNQLDEEAEPTGPDFTQDQINSIQACLDSALEKQNSLDSKTLSLARWKNVERFLEEIYFHYDIIFEYQKTLYNTWVARKGITLPGNGSSSTPIGIAIKILTILEQITQTENQLSLVNQSLDDYKRIFLENNKVFNQNLFLLNSSDTELNYQQITDFFQEKINANVSPINFNEETKTFPITEGVDLFFSKIQDIRNILLKKNEFNLLTRNLTELNTEKDINVNSLSSALKKPILSLNDLESIFKSASTSVSSGSSQDFAKGVFDAPLITNNTGNGYQGYGYNFVKNLEKFSARFSDVQFNFSASELKIELSLFTDFGNPLPYVIKQKPGKLSITGDSTPFFKTVSDPDIEKIKIGNEYAGNGGILSSYPSDYLRSNNFLTIKNIKEGESDVADFYDFFSDIISTGLSKETIIENIKTKRGVLYAKLIEKSASNWLFFSADERGDNDARNPANLKPASFDANGDPTPVFTEFWGNFKTKWDEKYTQTKNQDIVPEINKMKDYARKAGLGLGSVISTSDVAGIRVVENYFSTKKRIEQIEELILTAAQKRQEVEDQVTPQSIEADFSSIKCAVSSGVGSGGGGGANNVPGPETPCSEANCPPKCCGEAGSDFKSDNYLLSAPPSSDCPTIFSKCWLKQFCKHLTKVGLLPYPNGLPPIEKTSFFLGGGPSVRLGLKYWPVGYLPPAFIPIPIPNPVDGKPYIRVPLPMVWTIIPPIVIPLPLNLGTLIIFIPLIGGFMPTPLLFIKENINGTSFFLTGLRGPRFIPRKSDPKILDPLEKIKQIISFGFPDKLLPLPGFGLDNQDSLTRILENIQSNLVKILDGVPGPGNLDSLRELQQKEANLKSSINSKNEEYNKKSALLDIPKPNTESETNSLKSIPAERKDVLTKVISRYLKKGIPNPKSIYYPKDKDSLKIDTPGVVKSIRDIKDNISNLSPVTPPSTINLKDVFKDVLKNANVNIPSEYALDNKNLSAANRIILKALKDPREMNEEEFKDFVSKVRKQSTDVVKQMVDGNNLSIIESRKKGALAQLELAKFQGTFEFPPADAVCPPPKALKYNLVPNPLLDQIKDKLNQGIANAPFNPEDFSKYVRVGDNGVNTVIRVKDLKKIVSSKLGLSKKNPGDLERPIDSIDSLLKNFPFPNAPLTSELIMSNSFGTAISAFELPTAFPLKQDQITQTFGAGGIVQTTIPGTVIKNFIVKSVETGMKNGMLEKYFPEINDVNSSKFVNLEPQDIQKMTRSMITEVLDPNSPNIPDFLKVVNIPILPKARPTDMVEQVLIGLGVPPPARIVYSLFWKYFKGIPKSPLPEIITEPAINTAVKVLTKIPWPITVILGRNVINIISPMCLSDDHPSWRRMSLKNAYYVVYIDEFLRSAADVSGLFKFFFGDSVYPIPEFKDELSKAFNIKKY